MFDYHLHSRVSFDSDCPPADIAAAAEKAGLKEICFTDHYDFNDIYRDRHDLFTLDEYRAAYDGLAPNGLTVRRGVEFGLTPWNQSRLKELLDSYSFDFVIGSVHYAGGYDPYFEEFWTHHGVDRAVENYLLQTLECVKSHQDFDVLGHLNYVYKYQRGASLKPFRLADYSDICDGILKTLVQKGKGIEINTSGFDKTGDFLPSAEVVKRFRQLGGEIITVGSDAHSPDKVGQHIKKALETAKDVFGYVCTFEKRKVRFHKL